MIGVLSPLANSFDITADVAGQVMTTYALAYALLSPLLVSLTGRLGRRRVMAFGLALFVLAALLTAVAPNFFWLNVARVISAAGAGLFTPVAAAVVAALSPPEQRAKTLAAVFFGLTLAQVLGVPVGSYLAYTFGWQWAFALVVVIGLPCVWLIWVSVPAGLRFQPASLSDLGRVLATPHLMAAVLFTAAFLSAIYVVYTYMGPLLEEQMAFTPGQITLALLVLGIGAVLGNLLGGFMADKLGPQRTLYILATSQMVLLCTYSALPMPVIAVYLLIFFQNLMGWSFVAAQQARLVTLDAAAAPVLLALNAAAIYVGAAVGSAIGGFSIASMGISANGVVAGLCASTAILTLVIARRLASRHQAKV